MLQGDPELGKSFLSLTIAAAVTRGEPLPGLYGPVEICKPSSVLFLGSEDSLSDTVRVRFDRAGGDPTRFFALQAGETISVDGTILETAFSIQDADMLEAALEEVRPKLVVLDPLHAYLGPGVSMNHANEIRPILSTLGGLAERYDCAVLGLRHLNKSSSSSALYAASGSIDFSAFARSVLSVGESDGRRVLAHVKSSLAPRGPSFKYAIEDGHVVWQGVADHVTADSLRQQPQRLGSRDSGETSLGAAKEFLRDFLKDGPQPALTVIRTATAEGVSDRTLKRAKAELGVKSERISEGQGGSGKWAWHLIPSAGILGDVAKNPVLEARSASVPTIPLDTLPNSREGREKSQQFQGGQAEVSRKSFLNASSNVSSPKVHELRRQTEAGAFRGKRLKLPGRTIPDLQKTLETYFSRKNLHPGEIADLMAFADALGISEPFFN